MTKFQARKRIGFNALILAEDMEETKNMKKDQIVPIFWVEEGFLGREGGRGVSYHANGSTRSRPALDALMMI